MIVKGSGEKRGKGEREKEAAAAAAAAAIGRKGETILSNPATCNPKLPTSDFRLPTQKIIHLKNLSIQKLYRYLSNEILKYKIL